LTPLSKTYDQLASLRFAAKVVVRDVIAVPPDTLLRITVSLFKFPDAEDALLALIAGARLNDVAPHADKLLALAEQAGLWGGGGNEICL
jgi:hypothetical protein